MLDSILHKLEVFPAVVAAPNSGLVRHEHHRKAKFVDLRDGFGRTRNEVDVFGSMKVMRILDDYAISVQQRRRFGVPCRALLRYRCGNRLRP